MDPLGLGLGIALIAGGVGNFIHRDEVAARLAEYYGRDRAPNWLPGKLRARAGIRETRIIALAVTALLVGVGCWFVVGSVL